ncbi:MAG: hypothetical protein BIFFINMI_00354 [Phycisphaerae bacterium]|nr:hypothetical protein [Phycisphaerae bacterium]
MTLDLAMSLIASVGVPAALLLLGWLAGRWTEGSHLRRLAAAEAELAGLFLSDVKSFPPSPEATGGATLVIAEVVMGVDYLKHFTARIRKIFGGEVRSYSSMMARARREAVVRLLAQVHAQGYDAVCNVRLEMADIGGSVGPRSMPLAAILASGTAYRRRPQP